MESFNREDFLPPPEVGNYCGCEKHSHLVIADIRYEYDDKKILTVCHRQQCPECLWVKRNMLGKPFYFSFVSGDYINPLPEYFNAPDEYMYDADGKFNKQKKLDFMRRILTLANQNKNFFGHLYFTREDIDSVRF